MFRKGWPAPRDSSRPGLEDVYFDGTDYESRELGKGFWVNGKVSFFGYFRRYDTARWEMCALIVRSI
jgi:hypothetical protein